MTAKLSLARSWFPLAANTRARGRTEAGRLPVRDAGRPRPRRAGGGSLTLASRGCELLGPFALPPPGPRQEGKRLRPAVGPTPRIRTKQGGAPVPRDGGGGARNEGRRAAAAAKHDIRLRRTMHAGRPWFPFPVRPARPAAFVGSRGRRPARVRVRGDGGGGPLKDSALVRLAAFLRAGQQGSARGVLEDLPDALVGLG